VNIDINLRYYFEMNDNDLQSGEHRPRSTRLRISFSVGSEEDGRWITFADDVELIKIAEWFKFTGMAISRMFNLGQTPCIVRLTNFDPAKKIASIKIIREYTGCGLKEAKDAIEGAFDGIIGIFEDGEVAEAFQRALEDNDCTVEMFSVMMEDLQQYRNGARAQQRLYVRSRHLTSP
jgi:ribosomal protein L7/L12